MASALDKAAVGGTVVVSGNAGGGGFEGASRIDRGVAGWYPNHGSADAVLIPEKELMDARGNDALRMTRWYPPASARPKTALSAPATGC